MKVRATSESTACSPVCVCARALTHMTHACVPTKRTQLAHWVAACWSGGAVNGGWRTIGGYYAHAAETMWSRHVTTPWSDGVVRLWFNGGQTMIKGTQSRHTRAATWTPDQEVVSTWWSLTDRAFSRSHTHTQTCGGV